jgi:two-component system, chemotaxis family, sensor kinase Cph1
MAGTSLDIQDIQIDRLNQPLISSLTKIQSHGILLVLSEPDLTILQVSNNTNLVFGIAPAWMLGKPLDRILDIFQVEQFRAELIGKTFDQQNSTKIWVRKHTDEYSIFDAVFHRSPDGYLILELEPTEKNETIPFLSFYHLAKAAIDRMTVTANLPAFGQIVAAEVRKLTGFDRVMMYQFDEDGHGEVIAEDSNDQMESYLGLHFPESDIPEYARQLFVANRVRSIFDAREQGIEIIPIQNPLTHLPTDLTRAILRSPVPCHSEYLHNMQVRASLTISLVKNGRLWGMVVCHHQTPKFVSYELRKTCELLGQVIFAEISTNEDFADAKYRSELAHHQFVALDRISRSTSFIDSLMGHSSNLLDLVSAKGAAIYTGGNWTTIGTTPPIFALDELVQWLTKNVSDEVFVTDALSVLNPATAPFIDIASGLIAISVSPQTYLLCFRPEVLKSTNWGGDPDRDFQTIEADGHLSLHPRASFKLWQQIIAAHALPWRTIEIEAAMELRKAIVQIFLREAEELAVVATNLERSNVELQQFAYVASHDLQEPLNQVASYVQLLGSRYSKKLDQDAQKFIGLAVEGVNLMQNLIDDVLLYSKVGFEGIHWEPIDLEIALNRAQNHLRNQIDATQTIVTTDPLPTIVADSTQLTQLFQNLISNAIKFRTPGTIPQIHISATQRKHDWLFGVAAAGIGIEPQYLDRIFTIFQRLHTRDEYPGTGMGLTICKKIVECHHGKIWATSALGEGATFWFTIPVRGAGSGG